MKLFSIRAAVSGLSRLTDALRERLSRSKRKDQGSYTVGYSTPYALFVHENLEAHHEQGQAKFLEQPARSMQDTLRAMIRADMSRNAGLDVATRNAAIALFQKSQELVPVATGTLKASGAVRDQTGAVIAVSDTEPEETPVPPNSKL